MVDKMRPFISDLLDQTGGRVLRQVKFNKQVHTYLHSHQLNFSILDTESCTYNVRKVTGGLLNTKRDRKRPPARYQHLQVLVNKMHVSDDESMRNDDGEDTDDDEDDESCPCTAITPARRPRRSIQDVPMIIDDAVSIASSDGELVEGEQTNTGKISGNNFHDLDLLEKSLFQVRPEPAAIEPPAADEDAQAPIDDAELDALVNGCDSRGPVLAEYTKKIRTPRKRPAAAALEAAGEAQIADTVAETPPKHEEAKKAKESVVAPKATQ
jgi:hypothetical protein